jgi:ubiquitin carboxyl-terminal hydrolase 5/13
MAKVCNGLLSGRYSTKQSTLLRSWSNIVTVHPDGGKEESQVGIRPRMLKTLIGAGHAEFAGMKQQDAQEFLIWLLSRIQREGKPSGCVEQSLLSAEKDKMMDDNAWGGYTDPTKCFKFGVQQRIQCLGCGGVKYRIVEQDNINITVPDHLKPYSTLSPF